MQYELGGVTPIIRLDRDRQRRRPVPRDDAQLVRRLNRKRAHAGHGDRPTGIGERSAHVEDDVPHLMNERRAIVAGVELRAQPDRRADHHDDDCSDDPSEAAEKSSERGQQRPPQQ